MKNEAAQERLYIIGNGFDLYHGIKSSYWNFKEFVEARNSDLYRLLEEHFDADSLWSNFEETLADLEVDTLLQNANEYLMDYGSDDWSDAYHHAYEDEISDVLNAITITLKNLFTQWILQLDVRKSPAIKITKGAGFLNFNYTSSLESIYGIPMKSIHYLHNKAVDIDSTLILGHSRKQIEKINDPRVAEDSDPRVWNGNDSIERYFAKTYKRTEEIISQNIKWFECHAMAKEIFVLGHSLSEVDLGYFKQIARLCTEATWTVTYFDPDTKEAHLKTLLGLGIKKKQISQVKMGDLRF